MEIYIIMTIICIIYISFLSKYIYQFWLSEEWLKVSLLALTLPIYWFLMVFLISK